MKKALFAGSFNPPTLGHADIIRRASQLFDHLYIGIAVNSTKNGSIFSVEDKEHMLNMIIQEIPSVSIVKIEGLVVNFALQNGINMLVRGLRDEADFTREAQMASANRHMSQVETLLLVTDPRYAHLSSSLIREIGLNKQSLKGFIPDEINDFVTNHFSLMEG